MEQGHEQRSVRPGLISSTGLNGGEHRQVLPALFLADWMGRRACRPGPILFVDSATGTNRGPEKEQEKMPQYMISVWHEDDYELDFSGPDAQRRVAQVGDFNSDLAQAKALVFGAGLHPRSTAQVLRPQGGDVVMTDGPFAESKEHIGGFWIIDAPTLEAAQEWARKGAAACEQAVELRPLQG